MTLHPDIAALLEMVEAGTASGQRVPFPRLTPEAARADFAASSPLLDFASPALADERALTVPTRDGGVIEARLFASSPAALRPVLLYIHGGGFVVGDIATHESLCRELAHGAACAVLSIAYRRAPEHRFPTAFNDTVDALAWIGREGAAWGLDRERVAVAGDSAGGTLAAAAAIAARDDPTLPALRLQVLAYPGLSPRQDTDSHRRFGTGYLLEAETIQWFFGHYLRDDRDRDDWRFAPLVAPDLTGVAPALLVLAEFDPLVDEGIAYARRLEAAGVPVEARVYPGMIHEFLRMGAIVEDAALAKATIAGALKAAFLRGADANRR